MYDIIGFIAINRGPFNRPPASDRLYYRLLESHRHVPVLY